MLIKELFIVNFKKVFNKMWIVKILLLLKIFINIKDNIKININLF